MNFIYRETPPTSKVFVFGGGQKVKTKCSTDNMIYSEEIIYEIGSVDGFLTNFNKKVSVLGPYRPLNEITYASLYLSS